MKHLWVFSLVALCVVMRGTMGQTPPPAKARPAEQTSLVVESLLHSAENLYHSPKAPARAGRLVAIASKVADIAPQDPRALRLLSDVWQSQDRLDAAADAAYRQLQLNPQAYEVGIRWMRLKMAQLDRADERAQLLKGMVDTPSLPAPLRSAAATELAKILVGQGAQADALEVLAQAIELDPINHTALINRMQLLDQPTVEQRVSTILSLLRGNPRAWWISEELAQMLGEVGLHRQALGYLIHAWRLSNGDKPIEANAPLSFAVTYIGMMLDAGMAADVVQMFGPQIRRLAENDTGEFLSLMVEAYRSAGESAEADKIAKQAEALYQQKLQRQTLLAEVQGQAPGSGQSIDLAISLGWFNLLTAENPAEALKYAQQAAELGASGKGLELLTAAAKLRSGQRAVAETLRAMADEYPLAAAILAEFYFQTDQQDAGREMLLAGFKHARQHLAYRRLRALAKAQQYNIPPAQDSEVVLAALEGFDKRYLKMGVEPEAFIEVTLQPVKLQVDLCQAVEVEAVLSNIGEVGVPIGQWGLLDNRIGLRVRLFDAEEMTFQSLPVAIWPAPRVLPAGESLVARVRLDVGRLGEHLAHHPLKKLQLDILGTIAPQETSKGIVSGLPSVKVPQARVQRLGLLGEWNGVGSPEAVVYNRSLMDIERLLNQGSPEERMRAARMIAVLLGWIRLTETDQATIPEALKRVATKGVLLGLMAQAQRNALDLVRADLATTLNYANLGPSLLNQLGGMIEDPSPLVRFRMVELIGASSTKGNKQMVDMYANDPDAMVRLMARAFQVDPESLRPSPPPRVPSSPK